MCTANFNLDDDMQARERMGEESDGKQNEKVERHGGSQPVFAFVAAMADLEFEESLFRSYCFSVLFLKLLAV